MSEVKDDAAVEAAKEAFFSKIADPPDNIAVVIEKAEAAATEADDPKDAKEATGSAAAVSAAASKGTPATPAQPVSSADAVLAALRSGDLDAIAELTGADPADFDEKSTKWAARNRREAGLRKDVERIKAEAREILANYEPIEVHQEAFDRSGGRDFAPVRAIIEHVTGRPWAQVAPHLGVAGGVAPAPRAAAADKVLLEAVRDDVPDDHQVRQLPGWEQRVVAVLHEHLDDVTGEPSISFRQAAARAVRRAKEEHAKLAPIFGAPAPAPAARPATPERADGAAPAARRRLTQDEFYARFDRK